MSDWRSDAWGLWGMLGREFKQWVRLHARSRTLKPMNAFGARSHVFMHVGKTGGTSIQRHVLELHARGAKVPTMLQHKWTLPMVLIRYPKARIALTLRDPLERIVSGFSDRLRQSWPNSTIRWTNEEAIAFTYFDDVETFLRACISENPARQAAARYAAEAIRHVRRGYAFHFIRPQLVHDNAHRFYCIGHVGELDRFVVEMLAPLGVDPAQFDIALGRHNAGMQDAAEVLSGFSAREIGALKAFFAEEYEVYDALRAVASHLTGASRLAMPAAN